MEFRCQINTGFQQYIINILKEKFVLLDVGCAGGIDKTWIDIFANKLLAYGIDSNIDAINQLNKNQQDNIKYICAMVDVPWVGHDINNLWSRTSACEAQNIASGKVSSFSTQEVIDNNMYQYVESSKTPFNLDDLLLKQLDCLDFIKVDIDGPDFQVLQSIESQIIEKNILGVCIEVNYSDSVNRFSDVDKFLNSLGFECCNITKRYYDSKSLPGKFEYNIKAQTLQGRVMQGDALYLRDPCVDKLRLHKVNLSSQKLIKLMLLYDMFNMSSWAAEILSHFKLELKKEGVDVETALNILSVEAYKGLQFNFDNTYKGYMNQFVKDYTEFFPNKYSVKQEDFPRRSGQEENLSGLKNKLNRIKKILLS